MKNRTDYYILNVIAVIAALLVASSTFAQTPPAPAAKPPAVVPSAPALPDLAAITKERDELTAKLVQAQTAQQQTAIVTEYYKAVAERNEAMLRIVALQQELDKTKSERDAAQTELAALKAKGADQRALDAAKASIEAAKK